jgi:hypothetical protein
MGQPSIGERYRAQKRVSWTLHLPPAGRLLKSETWATHSQVACGAVVFLGRKCSLMPTNFVLYLVPSVLQEMEAKLPSFRGIAACLGCAILCMNVQESPAQTVG